VDSTVLPQRVLVVGPENIKQTNVHQYIDWGQEEEFGNRSTCRARANWYELPRHTPSDLLYSYISGDRHLIPLNMNVLADNNLFDIYIHNGDALTSYAYFVVLNSALARLFLELSGRHMTGALTVLKIQIYELERLQVVNPGVFDHSLKQQSESVVDRLGNRHIGSFLDEMHDEDRRELDDITFGLLGLTQADGDELYEAVAMLIQERLSKSASV